MTYLERKAIDTLALIEADLPHNRESALAILRGALGQVFSIGRYGAPTEITHEIEDPLSPSDS
jgi:hypothetical protein